MDIEVRRMSGELREDFYRVHSETNDAGWCRCVAWWVSTWEGWGNRTIEENECLRAELFDRGEYDGYLLYGDGNPVGWLQCGPRDRLPKLVQQYSLEPDPEAYAISCYLLAPSVRRGGLAHGFLEAVLDDLKTNGVTYVQGFPRRGEELPAGEVWTGTERLYQRAGFELERHDPRLPVYGKRL